MELSYTYLYNSKDKVLVYIYIFFNSKDRVLDYICLVFLRKKRPCSGHCLFGRLVTVSCMSWSWLWYLFSRTKSCYISGTNPNVCFYLHIYIYIVYWCKKKWRHQETLKTPNTMKVASVPCLQFCVFVFFSRFCRASMGPRKKGRGTIRWPSMSSHHIFPHRFWTPRTLKLRYQIPIIWIEYLNY